MTSAWPMVRNPRDAALVAAALGHAAAQALVLALAAAVASPAAWATAAAVIAFGVNWGSNTFSHIHLHTPLYRGRRANRAFALGLSVTLAIPQTWWKHRHLAHHRGRAARRMNAPTRRALAIETAAIVALWAALMFAAPWVFLAVYLPAWALGLALCWLQGHYEHAGHAAGVDHHGWFYNRFWFHDGFHAAHHVAPGAHWSTLGPLADGEAPVSFFPPVLRWLDAVGSAAARAVPATIDAIERHTLRFAPVRRFLLRTHHRALAAVLARAELPPCRRVCIVGGGLYPRTAIVLRKLLPQARLTILDADAAHLACARDFLASDDVEFRHGRFPGQAGGPYDLVVVPLAFRGSRAALYAHPPAPVVIIHDFFWRRGGDAAHASVIVSWLLGKRVNLVLADAGSQGLPQSSAGGWRSPSGALPPASAVHCKPATCTASAAILSGG